MFDAFGGEKLLAKVLALVDAWRSRHAIRTLEAT
jgi:hypothetical protein